MSIPRTHTSFAVRVVGIRDMGAVTSVSASNEETMASGSGGVRSFRVESYIRGYHVYQRIWNPELGEVVIAVREGDNTHDRYTVAILEAEICCVVHDLRLSSHTFSIMLLTHSNYVPYTAVFQLHNFLCCVTWRKKFFFW